jgi:hypothetical protein
LVKDALGSEAARAFIFPLLTILLAIGLRWASGERLGHSLQHSWTDVVAVACLGFLAIVGQLAFTWSADNSRLASSTPLDDGVRGFLNARDSQFPELLLRNLTGLLLFIVAGVIVAFVRRQYADGDGRAKHIATGAGWFVAASAVVLHILLALSALDLLAGTATLT